MLSSRDSLQTWLVHRRRLPPSGFSRSNALPAPPTLKGNEMTDRKIIEEGKYIANGREVNYEPKVYEHEDGSRSVGLRITVCKVWEHLSDPEGVAEMIAKALNDFVGGE